MFINSCYIKFCLFSLISNQFSISSCGFKSFSSFTSKIKDKLIFHRTESYLSSDSIASCSVNSLFKSGTCLISAETGENLLVTSGESLIRIVFVAYLLVSTLATIKEIAKRIRKFANKNEEIWFLNYSKECHGRNSRQITLQWLLSSHFANGSLYHCMGHCNT